MKPLLTAGESVLLKGTLGLLLNKSGIKDRFFVLDSKTLDYFATEDDFTSGRESRGHINLVDVATVTSTGRRFTIQLLERTHPSVAAVTLQADTKADALSWIDKMKPLIAGEVRSAGEAWGGEELGAVVLQKGYLDVRKNKSTKPRFVVLYSNRFEYFKDEHDFGKGESPRARVAHEDVQSFAVVDHEIIFEIKVDPQDPARQLTVCAKSDADLLAWVDSLSGQVCHTGDLPAKPMILTLHIDYYVSTLQLTDISGTVRFSGSWSPGEGAVTKFWSEVEAAVGKPKACIALISPDGVLIESDWILKDMLEGEATDA
mmetsp:Transcript_38862/g.77091  ORF Transcript_38862/g.77091 Transcript_38862/m.77091 type:complete len:316 (-) Transcript_38862:143-1090(-)